MKKYDASLTPEDVGELVGDADRDWDADIDFEEFRSFFPNVGSHTRELEARLQGAMTLQDLRGAGGAAGQRHEAPFVGGAAL